MKIGIDISQVVYQTGVSRYTAELVRHLVDIDKKDRFYLFGGSLRQKKLLASFASEVKDKGVSFRSSWLSPQLAEFFWNRLGILGPDYWFKDLDIWHASNWALPATKAKLVTTIHDLTFLKYPQTHTPAMIAAQTRHLKRSRQWADLVLTDSNSTKNDLIAWGMKPKKIKVIYPAPADNFKPVKSEKTKEKIRQKYGLKKPYLLSVATQEPRKNLPRLIKAFQKVKVDHPGLTLALAGKFGWGEAARPLKGVKLLGFVPEADLPGLYSSAKAFVYPSLYEGFGFPILEAFACGVPVVTSNVSSMPELGGEAAVYVDPQKTSSIASGIKKLLNASPDALKNLRVKGFKQAAQFSWEKTARETLKAYKQLVRN